MQLGMIGQGKMGAYLARHLIAGGYDCVVFDRDPGNVARHSAEGASSSTSL